MPSRNLGALQDGTCLNPPATVSLMFLRDQPYSFLPPLPQPSPFERFLFWCLTLFSTWLLSQHPLYSVFNHLSKTETWLSSALLKTSQWIPFMFQEKTQASLLTSLQRFIFNHLPMGALSCSQGPVTGPCSFMRSYAFGTQILRTFLV